MQDSEIKNKTITCTECENEFENEVSDLEVGDIIECPVCGANLEVVNTEPLTVAPVTTYK